ncbi:MAG: 5'-methylthioadenosine/S-adenosylhomocysteine nucleosidase [Clostridia bacterium]|nr:5'-methylthioadenosine/S-adenosylhomocysteine nucleosidase [Clostridia bacterium]
MYGFIVALKDEAEGVISRFSLKKTDNLGNKPVYQGKIAGKDAVLVISGIGKVSAALSTQALIDKFHPEKIINFGTAGGANESVEIISLYLIEKCCQYDFDLSELDGCSVGYMCDYDKLYYDCDVNGLDFLPKTNLCTADRFSNKIADINTVNSLKCSLRDMEGGAIAQVCLTNGVPFTSLKGVTDTYQNPAKQFYENKMRVCALFPDAVEKIVKAL